MGGSDRRRDHRDPDLPVRERRLLDGDFCIAGLTEAQHEKIGDAVANVEAAIDRHHEMLHSESVSPGALVGEMLRMALSRKGFVIVADHEAAARLAAEYERAIGRLN